MTIAIRAATPEDAAAIATIYAQFVKDGVVSFEATAPGPAQMRERMASSDGFYPWLVASDAGNEGEPVLGYAYAGRFRERDAYRYVTETSIYLAGAAEGRGVGRALYGALLATLRVQGFTQAMGVIALPNDRSVRLHEALGFRRAGVLEAVGRKHGQWVDIGLWQCALAARGAAPAELRRFVDVGVRQSA